MRLMAELSSHYRLPFPLRHSDLHTPVIVTSLDLKFVLRISSSALDLNADELIADGMGFCSHEELARSVHLLGMMSLPSSL
jgi:hypothetical protein